jgi:peroxiredoxin
MAVPLSLPEFDAFLVDREHGRDPRAELYRGRMVSLPVLESPEDVPFDLAARAADRRLVLLFYPGGWSASARSALVLFNEVRAALDSAATTLCAVTPETPFQARRTIAATGIGFPVAIDHMCRFTKSLGIAFKVPLPLRRIVRDRGVRLSSWNGEQSYDLPMPALVLLDRERRVRCAQATWTAAYLDPSMVLEALAQLAAAD